MISTLTKITIRERSRERRNREMRTKKKVFSYFFFLYLRFETKSSIILDLFSEELDPHRLMTVTCYSVCCYLVWYYSWTFSRSRYRVSDSNVTWMVFGRFMAKRTIRNAHETFSNCQERQTIGHFQKQINLFIGSSYSKSLKQI